ncbi:ECF transporter S component [Crassaminicella profunda]|uniref:ECF transporter S component n=1 Tax=Crassaminicella profunda TaxID=1286698 RepID=UPI001CA7A5A9|nr:ECF transporter S component [Crassaminicella profunda]QZY54793.1 ECF transporter S component [Crassaminicella profunda]
MNKKTKKMVIMGMFIALSFVGSYIKIPSPLQSIALDAMPAFLGGITLGGGIGALIGFIGHLLTSANAGFPLSLPIHLLIAVMMAITVLSFSITYKKTNIIIAGIVGIVLNGAGAPLLMALMPQFGWVFFMSITPFLLLASGVNVILAILVFLPLKQSGFLKREGFDLFEK